MFLCSVTAQNSLTHHLCAFIKSFCLTFCITHTDKHINQTFLDAPVTPQTESFFFVHGLSKPFHFYLMSDLRGWHKSKRSGLFMVYVNSWYNESLNMQRHWMASASPMWGFTISAQSRKLNIFVIWTFEDVTISSWAFFPQSADFLYCKWLISKESL